MLNLRFWDFPSLHLLEDRRREKGTKQLLSLQSLMSVKCYEVNNLCCCFRFHLKTSTFSL